jgi:hypothetical protein
MTSGVGQDGGAAVQLGIVLKPELTGTVKAEARSSASSRRNGRPLCPARHGTLVCAATSRGQEGSLQLQARTLTLIRRKGVPVRSRRLRSKYVCAFSVILCYVRVTQRFADICAARGLALPTGNTERLSHLRTSGCRALPLASLALGYGVHCHTHRIEPFRHVACGTACFETAEAYAITLVLCSGPNANRPSAHGRLVVDAAYFLRGSEPRPRRLRGGRGVGHLLCTPRERGERLRFGAHSARLALRRFKAQRAAPTASLQDEHRADAGGRTHARWHARAVAFGTRCSSRRRRPGIT